MSTFARSLLLSLQILFLLLIPATVLGQVPVKFCFTHPTAYDDASPTLGDDHYVDSPAEYAAAGLYVKVWEIEPIIGMPATLVWSGYTAEAGADRGCTPDLSVKIDRHLRYDAFTKARVNGKYVRLTDGDLNLYQFSGSPQGLVEQGWNGSVFTFPATDPSHVAAGNIMAVAELALAEMDPGLPGETFFFRDNPGPCAGGASCAILDTVYLNDATGWHHKSVIAHEVGHVVSFKANMHAQVIPAYMSPNDALCTDAGGIGSHRINSKEYQLAAAYEGFADFYSYAVFNEIGEADCRRESAFTYDFDGDGSGSRQYSCYGAPNPTDDPLIDSDDYLGDYCDGTDVLRGVELDWSRFFWEVVHDGVVDFGTLLAIWDFADLHSAYSTVLPFPPPPPPLPGLPFQGACYPSDCLMMSAMFFLAPPEHADFVDRARTHGILTSSWFI